MFIYFKIWNTHQGSAFTKKIIDMFKKIIKLIYKTKKERKKTEEKTKETIN